MTLIELMIAGVLGLVISYFVMNIMISSNRVAASSDGIAQAQESGRFIMSWLREEVRRAGYAPVLSTATSVIPFVANTECTTTSLPPADGADCSFDSNSSNDRIAIRWTYNPDSAVDRDQQDCTGTSISFTEDTNLIDVYWVETDTGTGGDSYDDVLRCVTYNDDTGVIISPQAQTIASGILGMQVLYGETVSPLSTGETNVTRYINGSNVTNWSNIQAVRLSILTRSFSTTTADNATRSYILLDADAYTFTDRDSYYIQTTTIALHNR